MNAGGSRVEGTHVKTTHWMEDGDERKRKWEQRGRDSPMSRVSALLPWAGRDLARRAPYERCRPGWLLRCGSSQSRSSRVCVRASRRLSHRENPDLIPPPSALCPVWPSFIAEKQGLHSVPQQYYQFKHSLNVSFCLQIMIQHFCCATVGLLLSKMN